MDELEVIVRAVANPDMWVYDCYTCKGCGALTSCKGEMDEPHTDVCPFGRAVAWVAAHPEAK